MKTFDDNKYLWMEVEKKLSPQVTKPHPKQVQKYPDPDPNRANESRIYLLPEPSTQSAWGRPGPVCPSAVIFPS